MRDKVERFCDWKGPLCEEEQEHPTSCESESEDDEKHEHKHRRKCAWDIIVSFTDMKDGRTPPLI